MKKQLKKLLHKLEKKKQHEESILALTLDEAQCNTTWPYQLRISGRVSAYDDCIKEIQSIIYSLNKK